MEITSSIGVNLLSSLLWLVVGAAIYRLVITPLQQRRTVLSRLLRFRSSEGVTICYGIIPPHRGSVYFLLHQQTPSRRNFSKVVLLNPVTDFRHTFYDHVGGELMEEFSAKNWEQVFSHGQVTLLPGKTMSRRLAVELLTLKPYLGFDNLESPTMVLHGSADTSVSSELTRINSARSKLVTFREIPGANHAFASPWEEKETFSLIRQWFAH